MSLFQNCRILAYSVLVFGAFLKALDVTGI